MKSTFRIEVHADLGDIRIFGSECREAMDERVSNTGYDAHDDQDYDQDDLYVVDLILDLTHLVVHLPALINPYPWFLRILLS